MAKIITQNIPPAMADAYDASLQRATLWKSGGDIYQVRKRVPFRIGHVQNFPDGHPTPAQIKVRDAFKLSCNCFRRQPASGGVVPPAIGPRDRSWWYNAAVGSGLWYYDYFIQQTWPLFYSGQIPDWCSMLFPGWLNPDWYKGNSGSGFSSCVGAWDSALSGYLAATPDYTEVAAEIEAIGWVNWYNLSPPQYSAGIGQQRASVIFDLTPAKVAALVGSAYYSEVRYYAHFMSGYIPGNYLKDWSYGPQISPPAVSGWKLFDSSPGFSVSDGPVVVSFGGQDWDEPLDAPPCPTTAPQVIGKGLRVDDVKLAFL